jgi:EmrB/QacA subfamily drug resistance transporter
MRGRVLVLVTLCLAALIINLDTTIVNVALPALVRQTGATTTDLQWVVDAYNLVFAALILAAGSLADRLGRKGMLLAGLGVFGGSSLAGSFATSAGQLTAARAVMGLGAAMMFPSTLSLLTNVFTARRERALAIGVWGASAGVGIALGPIAGGWLLEQFWWGAIFVFMAPVAAVVAALVAWTVPTSRNPRTPPVDWRGFALSTAGMSLIVYGIIQAPGWGWASAATLGTLAAGLVLLGALVAAERATAAPMIDVHLFRNPRFTAGAASVAIAFFALLGFIFLMTQYFQVVRGYSPLGTGVRLLPVAVSVGVASVMGTRLAVRVGSKLIVGGGMALFCAALAWISFAATDTSYGIIAVQMVVLGIGMGFTQAPATESIMGAVPKQKAGIASAVNGATRLFGGTLGVAVIGSVAASLYTSRLTAVARVSRITSSIVPSGSGAEGRGCPGLLGSAAEGGAVGGRADAEGPVEVSAQRGGCAHAAPRGDLFDGGFGPLEQVLGAGDALLVQPSERGEPGLGAHPAGELPGAEPGLPCEVLHGEGLVEVGHGPVQGRPEPVGHLRVGRRSDELGLPAGTV